MTEETPALDFDREPRLVASVDAWKRKLLDLSKRNRALNYRASGLSSVEVIGAKPADAFRWLYLQEHAIRFRPTALGSAETSSDRMESARAPLHDIVAPLPSIDTSSSESATSAEGVTGRVFQVTLTRDQLDRSLRRLEELARTTIDEQGVNTLFLALGMLRYTESEDSEQILHSPLVLVPVGLSRKSAGAQYALKVADDDPSFNPSLTEYLRVSFGISAPSLPDPDTIADDFDLDSLFMAFQAEISQMKNWAIESTVVLSRFSFQKFAMYKDLSANSRALAAHRIVHQVTSRITTTLVGLPNEIRAMDLDTDFRPETTFQVVDADSSQLRALAAVARGHDCVLDGPPGTGKSQTIANLIAQALSMGKSVLFVAEKMAALRVVYERLAHIGLGEFCLELHSTKANKRQVMSGIAAALDASLQRSVFPSNETQRLPEVRASLTEYTRAVHLPFGPLGISPYRAYGELERVADAPRVRLTSSISQVTLEQLETTVSSLEELAATASLVGRPAEHPWRDSARTFVSDSDLDEIEAIATDLADGLDDILRRTASVRERLQLTFNTLDDLEAAKRVAAVMARSPGAPLSVLENKAWNTPPMEARALLDRGRNIVALKKYLQERFTREVLEYDHAADIAYVERKSIGLARFLRLFDGHSRRIAKRWRAYRLPAYKESLRVQIADLKRADELRYERAILASQEEAARECFGALWTGETSEWQSLEEYVQWVVQFRQLCVQYSLPRRVLQLASERTPDASELFALGDAAEKSRSALEELRGALSWPVRYLDNTTLEQMRDRIRSVATGRNLGPRWAAFETSRQRAAAGLAAEAIPPALTGEIRFADLPRSFLRAFFQKWLVAVVQEREPLLAFHTIAQEQRISDFRRLDRLVLAHNRALLRNRLGELAQERLRTPDAAVAMGFLRRELARQKRHKPLRKTLRLAEAAIRAIKPCFMMSPLTVAQCLDGSEPTFDLVVFDEASQLPTEDAIGAIIRGRQLVVVGDPKQLPPSNYFKVLDDETAQVESDDGGEPLVEDSESVLEEFMASGAPSTRLKWHYRSRHESLILFSNVTWYDSELNTFPSVETNSHEMGLQFEYVEDGVYAGGGLNRIEARRVAEAVVQHARDCPELSLGVGAFSLRQQLAILDEIELLRRADPVVEPFFATKEHESFFVKNLENIQGDERDVIFLSITYGKGRDGKILYRFGPLNSKNGWRRLNVLITRARQRMRVFSSMRGHDISTTTASQGATLLRDFLLFAETGRLNSSVANAAAQTESPFEREVYRALTESGLTLVPQVGEAGYRIDFGVRDEAHPGRYLCGLECDGVAYHSSETARDRDRLRQQVLEDRGWTLFRIWSTDWFKDRKGQIERILHLVGDAASARGAEGKCEVVSGAVDEAAGGDPETPLVQQLAPIDRTVPTDSAASLVHTSGYCRPAASPYRVTPGEGRFALRDILAVPSEDLVQAVLAVVRSEAPLHRDDLVSRVAGMWGNRAGSRIAQRILRVCYDAERRGWLVFRGAFVWSKASDGVASVRSRTSVNIPAERICPEEYREAALTVLRTGHSFARPDLIVEVRALMGFSRTGAVLERAINAAIDTLVAEKIAGEGSTGITLLKAASRDATS
jgi:very-short-patch-repair endonuclease